MTKVSEEQPQDTFSLFLRHMSIGDYPVTMDNKQTDAKDSYIL
jgi:hypothetical protein